MHHGKAAHRPRAKSQQSQAGNQGGDVRIENGGPGPLVADVDGHLGRGALAQFLADALVDQHIRINGHTNRQCHGSKAGQRQGGLQHRQHGHQHQHIHPQRNAGKNAEQHVVPAHEDRDGQHAPDHTVDAALDIVRPQARADGEFLDDLHGRSQRTSAQQQRSIVRFHGGHAARYLHAATGNLGADHRGRHHLALALLEQDDGHALVDVLTCDLAENARALGVKREVDRGFLRLTIKACLCVGEVFTGQDDLFLHDHRLPGALQVALGTKRHRPLARLGSAGLGTLVHQAHLQRGGAAQNIFGLGRVLHTGQLHNDAVQPLLLDHRLGHAQFVDPVVQRGDVLLEGLLLHAARGLGLDAGTQLEFCALGRDRGLQIGELVRDQIDGGLASSLVTHPDLDELTVAADAAMADVLVAQGAAQVTRIRLGLFGQRRLHVHLQHEMHATTQIQPQVHGLCVQGGQPGGRARDKVQRHDVGRVLRIGHQRPLDRILGLELGVGRIETGAHRGAIEADEIRRDPGGLERLFHALQHGGVHLDGGFGRRDLHGRRLAEEIGQGVEHPHQQRDHQDRVLPDRITVHFYAFSTLCQQTPRKGHPGALSSRALFPCAAREKGKSVQRPREMPINYLIVPLGRTCTTAER